MKTFRNGDRAKTIANITLPHATVAAGITGRIADVDPEYPADVIFVPDDPSPDLADWNNFVPANAAQLEAIRNPWRAVGRAWIIVGIVGALLFTSRVNVWGLHGGGATAPAAHHVFYPLHMDAP